MRISIKKNGNDLLELNQLNINGRKTAGGYGFTFSFKGNRRGCDKTIFVFDIRLSLALSDPAKPIITSIPSSTQIVQCHNYPNNNEQLYFEAVLTKEQVNALEEYRQNNDLRLNVGLRAMSSSDGILEANYECEDLTVPRERWLKALNNSGFRQAILFEMSLPSASEDLVGLYTKAQEFIETGHYKDAVMQCRHIIEKIESIREDKRDSSAANNKAHDRKERQSMTSIERLLSLREQLKNVCQLGAHGDESFTRSQAKSVLAITMALLAEPTVGYINKTQ
jgi:hypothetical protein